MANHGRDAFGELTPLKGESASGVCAHRWCQEDATEDRATSTTSFGFCEKHARRYDAGQLAGSVVFGFNDITTVIYVEDCIHFVRYSNGHVEFRRDGRNGWITRDAAPIEYEMLTTGWRRAKTDEYGGVATPAQFYDE